jgi:predicted RNA binding protein YcfA (HicA-like mRNA interferase family)
VSKLPSVSGRNCIKALQKELAKGTLRAIIRDADLSVDEFIALL